MKKLLLVTLAFILSACGAYDERTAGIEQETLLVLRSESLVGATIEITPGFSKVITEEDLTPFTMGMAASADRENQNLETVTLKVEDGTQRLTISRGANVIYNRDVYFTAGQTRELRIRQ